MEQERKTPADAVGASGERRECKAVAANVPDDRPALRPYQETFIRDIFAAFRGGARSVVAVAPTGSGKTVAFADVVAKARPNMRVLIAAHRIEILDQISAALCRVGVAHGRIAPGYDSTDQNVQIASIPTFGRRLDQWRDRRFDLIVADECHHAVAPGWAATLASQPRAPILGFTATPERLDGRGLSDIFDSMVIGPTTAELIAGGYLAPFVVFAPAGAPSMEGVRIRMGDFATDDLRERMGAVVIRSAVDEYRRIAPGQRALAFCVDIEHSKAVANAFCEAGIGAAHVDGDTPADERKAVLGALAAG